LNILFFLSDESSSGEEDLDEEGIQRRRDLMRQRALTRAQIGVGQEEIMVRLSFKSYYTVITELRACPGFIWPDFYHAQNGL
jgi:hypothetical protein